MLVFVHYQFIIRLLLVCYLFPLVDYSFVISLLLVHYGLIVCLRLVYH